MPHSVYRFIYSKNRNNLSYRLSVNHMADRTDEEMKLMNGYHYTHGDHGGLPFDKTKYNLKDVPDQVDWRLFGKKLERFIRTESPHDAKKKGKHLKGWSNSCYETCHLINDFASCISLWLWL